MQYVFWAEVEAGAVEHPAKGLQIMDVPEIQRSGDPQPK